MAKNLDLDAEARKIVARLICGYIDASNAEKSGYLQWVEQCERVHYSNPGVKVATTDGDDPGYEITHRPLSAPRQDALKAQVCTVVGKQRPFMLATSDAADAGEGRAELVHRVWSQAMFPRRIRQACEICTDSDLVYYRFCGLGQGRMEISVHHPRDVAVFPALPSGFDDAILIGHRVPKPRKYVVAGRKAKRYYDSPVGDSLSGGMSSEEGEDVAGDRSGATQAGGPRPALDGIVDLWDVVVRLDLKNLDDDAGWTGRGEQWYRATVCRDGGTLLALEKYTLSTPWYVTSRLVGSLNWYPTRSVARDNLSLQQEYSNLWSLYRFAVQAAAVARVYSANEPDVQFDIKRPYDVSVVDNPQDMMAVPGQANVREIPFLLQLCERNADKNFRISQNTTGADASSSTATEASIIASGVAVGLEEYIDNFTGDFPRAAKITEEIIKADYDGFASRYNIVDEEPQDEPEDPMQDLLDAAQKTPFGGLIQGLVAALQGQPNMGAPAQDDTGAAPPDNVPGGPPLMQGADPTGSLFAGVS